MPENQQSENGMARPKYWRLFRLTAAAICAASIGTVIAILRNPEWYESLLRFLGRAWDIFVTQDVGSTTRGFFNGCLVAIVSIFAVAVMTGHLHGWKEFKKHLVETAIIALFAVPTVTIVIYGTQFAWEVAKLGHEDHQKLVRQNSELTKSIAPKDQEIQRLGNQLTAACYIPDRRLTQAKLVRDQLMAVAEKYHHPHVLFMWATGDTESKRFGNSLIVLFGQAEFKVDQWEEHPLNGPIQYGDSNHSDLSIYKT